LPPAHLRFTGVLQRIALCFAGVVPLAIHAKNHARSGGRSRRCCSATGHCCGSAVRWAVDQPRQSFRQRGVRPLRLSDRPGERPRPRSGRPARHAAVVGVRRGFRAAMVVDRGRWIGAASISNS